MIASLVLSARPLNASCQCSGLSSSTVRGMPRAAAASSGSHSDDAGDLRPPLEGASPCERHPRDPAACPQSAFRLDCPHGGRCELLGWYIRCVSCLSVQSRQSLVASMSSFREGGAPFFGQVLQWFKGPDVSFPLEDHPVPLRPGAVRWERADIDVDAELRGTRSTTLSFRIG